MDSSELYDAFRSDVVDTATPYLWTDDEVWRYMNDAYRMFVRLTGGVSDFTSTAAAVPIVSGDPIGVLDSSILRIMSAKRRSDSVNIKIINFTDLDKLSSGDYGRISPIKLDSTPGPVNHGVIGMQRDVIRWVQVPEADDTADLIIYRLPLNFITDAGQAFTDVDVDHHINLLDWMEHLAYKKQDAETFDRARSEENEASFRAYCAFVKAEIERYKHKTRSVSYGGL